MIPYRTEESKKAAISAALGTTSDIVKLKMAEVHGNRTHLGRF